MQKTIKNKLIFEGKGLHNNLNCKITLIPNNKGLRINNVPINPFFVTSTSGMTTINGISQLEHILSCLFALGIDNLDIISSNNELPIMDGCNRKFIDEILKVGIVELDQLNSKINIKKEVLIRIDNSYIKYIPKNQNYITFKCKVDFPYVGEQEYSWNSNNFNDYYYNISNAKTFFWKEQIDEVILNNGAKGVDKDNTIIIDSNNYKTFNNNEFAKHKLLDLIGDITMIPISGGIIEAYRPGHKINNIFARELLKVSFADHIDIPFVKLPKLGINDKFMSDIRSVFDKQNYIDKNITEDFENKLANFLNVKNVISVNSGTSSIIIALLSLEINDDEFVVVPRLTFWATYQAVKLLGKKVILVDVDQNYQLDNNLLVKIIDKYNVKVVLTVNLYGLISENFDELKYICKKNNIILVEDSSQAFGTKYKNKNILTKSYISCVSMFPTKIYGSCGNSGFIVTSDDTLASKMKSLRDNGRIDTRYDHYMIGGNFVLDSLNCLYNINKLKYMEDIIDNTSYKYEIYNNELINLNFFKIPRIKNCKPNGFNFTIKSLIPNKRDKIMKILLEQGIVTQIIYPKTIDQQKGYDNDILFLNSNYNLCNNIFSLPIYYDLTPYQQNFIVEKLKENDIIKTVVLGYGNMGKKHVDNIVKNKYFKLEGIVDLYQKDYVKQLESSNNLIDLAIIATNTPSHFDVAVECIGNNNHLLIEKPGFLFDYQFDKIKELANKNNLYVGISMLERYNSFLNKIDINDIKLIEIKRITPYSKNFSGNNILLDLFIHDLDILVYFSNLNLSNIVVKTISKENDIIYLDLMNNDTLIKVTVGNSNDKSERYHKYYKDNDIINYNFINKENKIKCIQDDYINFLTNKNNMICTLEENKNLVNFISQIMVKLGLYQSKI